MTQLKLIGAAVALLLALAIGALSAWQWQANKYDSRLAKQDDAYQADLTRISNAGAEQARQALEKQQAAEHALAALDQKATEEKAHDLAENEKHRVDVAAGTRRVRVAGTCTPGNTSSSNVPSTASATRLGDAGTVELSPTAGSTVLDIRAGIIADQAALRALQSYVMNVCR